MKFSYDNESEIPADLKQYYKEVDGKWILQCEGAVSKARIDEFRTKNLALEKTNRELVEKFKDVDPDEYTRLKGIELDLQSGKIKGTKAEEILEQRTAEMKKAHDKALQERDQTIAQATTELSRLKIADAAVGEGTKLGLRPTAKDDLVARVSGVFRLEGGKPVAYGADGQKMYGADGNELTIKEYTERLTKDAAHLFESSEGTGAGNGNSNGGKGGGVLNGRNPWMKDHHNVTQQGQLMRDNPKEAIRLARAAGKKITIPGYTG